MPPKVPKVAGDGKGTRGCSRSFVLDDYYQGALEWKLRNDPRRVEVRLTTELIPLNPPPSAKMGACPGSWAICEMTDPRAARASRRWGTLGSRPTRE